MSTPETANPLRVPLPLQMWRYDTGHGVVLAVSDEMPVAFIAAGRRGLPPAPDLTERIGPLVAAAPMMRDALVVIARAFPGDLVPEGSAEYEQQAAAIAAARGVLALMGIVP